MIKVEHLKKRYAAVNAVDDISFEIGKNEIVGLLGPNGAGKSTTIKVLTCFHSATDGNVTIDGKDVFEDPEGVKAVIGYLPENVPLYPELRVREYLTYRAGLKGISRKKRTEAVDRAIARCRIEEVRNRIIGQLSKGYRQRVGLADALLAEPKILILDEPTVGLDPNQIRDVRELITELGRERTVILSSHILPEVEAVCSRVIIINHGKIVGQGKPSELRQKLHSREQIVEVEVKGDPVALKDALKDLSFVRTVEPIAEKTGWLRIGCHPPEDECETEQTNRQGTASVRERIFDIVVENNFKLLSMNAVTRSLEDIFVEIVTSEGDGTSRGDVDSPADSAQSQGESGKADQ